MVFIPFTAKYKRSVVLQLCPFWSLKYVLSLRRQLWGVRIRGSGEEDNFGLNENYEKGQCNMAESSGHTEHQLLAF